MSESIKLVRHALASIDLSDIDDTIQTEAERKEYCSAISAVYPRIKKDIERMLHKQLLFCANQSETWDQVLVGRGVFAGMEMLLEYWSNVNQEYIDRLSPEAFDKHSATAEL